MVIGDLPALPNCKIEFSADLTEYSWLRTGGTAECLIQTNDPVDIQKLYQHCFEQNIAFQILGRGTNCLISDDMIKGIVFRYNPSMWWEEDIRGIWVDASIPIPALISLLHKSDRIGLEFAAGIPGTVGGCLKMNAGTQLGEFKDIFLQAICITKEGQIYLDRKDITMQYRSTNIDPNIYIWKVLLKALQRPAAEVTQAKKQMRGYLQYRNETQPLDLPTLGSTFKNPMRQSAGHLIQQAGLCGYQIGGVQVSTKHGNFLINVGSGTCTDALLLIEHVQSVVFEQFRIKLEVEVQILR